MSSVFRPHESDLLLRFIDHWLPIVLYTELLKRKSLRWGKSGPLTHSTSSHHIASPLSWREEGKIIDELSYLLSNSAMFNLTAAPSNQNRRIKSYRDPAIPNAPYMCIFLILSYCLSKFVDQIPRLPTPIITTRVFVSCALTSLLKWVIIILYSYCHLIVRSKPNTIASSCSHAHLARVHLY